MPISADAARLQTEAIRSVESDSIIISRYLLWQGDGVTTTNSWSWVDSWRAQREEIQRGTWLTQVVDGQSSRRLYLLTVPASSIPGQTPAVQQQIKLLHTDGTEQGIWRINFVTPLQQGGHVYAYQLTVEHLQ